MEIDLESLERQIDIRLIRSMNKSNEVSMNNEPDVSISRYDLPLRIVEINGLYYSLDPQRLQKMKNALACSEDQRVVVDLVNEYYLNFNDNQRVALIKKELSAVHRFYGVEKAFALANEWSYEAINYLTNEVDKYPNPLPNNLLPTH